MINESTKLIELTTPKGTIYISSAQIATVRADGTESAVEAYDKNSPVTYYASESPATIAAGGNFVSLNAGDIYLNVNRISSVKSGGAGSIVTYAAYNSFGVVNAVETPAQIQTAISNTISAATSDIKTFQFTWDSTVDGPWAGFGVGNELLAEYGTPGMAVTPVSMIAYFDNIATGFAGGATGTIAAFLALGGDPITLNPLFYMYNDDGGNDLFPGTTAYLKPTTFTTLGLGFTLLDPINPPGKVYWYAENPGGSWSVTGRFTMTIGYIEVTP